MVSRKGSSSPKKKTKDNKYTSFWSTYLRADQILPIRRFLSISLPVIRAVRYNVGKSRVDVKMSMVPNGSMGGIQPSY